MSFNYISLTVLAATKAAVKSATERIPVTELENLYSRETSILRLTVIDSAGVAVALGASDEYELAIDSTRRHVDDNDDLMAYSDNDEFDIAGDWPGSSRANGELAVRVDCSRALFASRITAADGSQECFLQIRVTPDGETNTSTLIQDLLMCNKNVIQQYLQ